MSESHYTRDPEKTAIAELAFKLGKITRNAIDHGSEKPDAAAVAAFANQLLEAGEGKVAADLVMVFVAGFEEGEPPERRKNPAER